MKIFFKIIVLSLVAILFLHSCTVYYKQSYTPEEVVKSQKKFRMIDRSGKKYPFYKLVREDENYYALARNSIFYRNKFKDRPITDLGFKDFSTYLIDPGNYEKFEVKNTAGSAITTALIGVVASAIILWIVLDNYFDDFLFTD
ncbi:MAG: hypothetical protein WB492_12250 [Christiangramia sp.]